MTKDFTVVYSADQTHHNPVGCLLKMHIPGSTKSGFLGDFLSSLTRPPDAPHAHSSLRNAAGRPRLQR